jgi:hypothetical protein
MAVLATCLERVDAEHMPAYLESTNPANDLRYKGHGFERHGTVTLPNGGVISTAPAPSRRRNGNVTRNVRGLSPRQVGSSR